MAMHVNPGGGVAPDEAIGRDALIERLWKKLDKQSLVLVAERRMGKTTILKKMAAEPKAGFRLVYRDVESCENSADIASIVATDVAAYLTHVQSAVEALRKFWYAMGGIEVGGALKLPKGEEKQWKDGLTQSFSLLSQMLRSTRGERVVLAWDEFPLMLKKISNREGAGRAMDVLDLLRALRSHHPQVRQIFTGSIGLHHVVSELREQDYPNSPKNDMYTVEVPPLEPNAAITLATNLFEGEGLGDDPDGACARTIAESVDCMAYYIHHMVAAMTDQDLAPSMESAEKLVAQALLDPIDRWELRNYRERLDSYYADLSGTASLALDLIAEGEPLSLDDLLTGLRLRGATRLNAAGRRLLEEGEDSLRKRLWRLLQDHYLQRDNDGRYRFRFAMIRRWWLLK